jgi:hypothetical protein
MSNLGDAKIFSIPPEVMDSSATDESVVACLALDLDSLLAQKAHQVPVPAEPF